MRRDDDSPQPAAQAAAVRLGVVVHPSRQSTGRSASCAGGRPGMAVRWCRSRRLVSIGGDGTALAAIHAGAAAARPVLAVACGSPGALTSVPSHRLVDALERFRGATRSDRACRRSR
jgi:ATP-NAD kinase